MTQTNPKPLTLNFNPISKPQAKFFHSTKKELLLSGSVGAGKTLAGCWKGFLLNIKYPGNRGLICRKEATSLEQSTKHKLLTEVIPPEMIVKIDHAKNYLIHRTSNPKINSVIVFSGLDKRADQSYPVKIASTEYGWIFCDEISEFYEDDYNVLLARLRYQIKHFTREQNEKIPRQIFGATNPDAPTHWLHRKFFEENIDERQVILTSTYDNKTLTQDYIRSLETSLTGIARERLLFGRWVQAEGIIYDMFDRMEHVVRQSELNNLTEYKYFVLGADSNFPKPRAAVLVGMSGNGVYHVIDEFYLERASIEDLIDWVGRYKNQRLLGRPLFIYHDPSDAQSIEKFKQKGFNCEKANNQVIPGIDTVASLLKNKQLIISDRCVCLLKEMVSYRWKKGTKDTPEKVDDHAVDALRYALHSDMNKLKAPPKVGVFYR